MQAQKADADTALVAHTAAYRVLQALCQGLSDAEAIKAVFAEHGGNQVHPCVVRAVSRDSCPKICSWMSATVQQTSHLQPCCCPLRR